VFSNIYQFNTFAAGLIQAVQVKTSRLQVVLGMHNSGAESARELFKAS